MGRPTKPTVTKELEGAYRKDPQRRNHAEPVPPSGWPDRPEWVDEDEVALACWNRVCGLLDEMKLLSKADHFAIEGYCADYSQWRILREFVKGGQVSLETPTTIKISPESASIHQYQSRMTKFWTEYGMTPASRSKLIAKAEDEDEDLMGAMMAKMRARN